MSDLMNGVKAVLENFANYQEAEDYYTGACGEIFANATMRRLLEKTGDKYKINLSRTPVDVVADRLAINSVSVVDSAEQTAILQRDVWEANDLGRRSSGFNRDALEYGDNYVFVWDGEDEGTVQIIANNPKATRVIYDVETKQKAQYAVKLWKEDDTWRATLYYADRIERWVTIKNGKAENPVDWKQYTTEIDVNGDAVWPVDNPYGRIPVFHLRTDGPYGVPEHKNAYGPQNAINKLVVTQMGTTDYHGFPQRYALAEASTADSDDDATDWGDNDTEADATTGTKSKLKGGPGEMWFLDGIKSAGQFDAADPHNFMDPLEIYVRLMAQTTTTPLHYFDPSGDTPSGESLRTANAPLDKKCVDRQDAFGPTHADYLEFALLVLGVTVTTKVQVDWKPVTHVQDKDGWEVAALKLSAGVPPRQVFQEMGYTAAQLDEWNVPEIGQAAPAPAVPA